MAKDDDILEEARELFELCEEREADNRDEALDDLEFARLARQWRAEDEEQRAAEGRPCLTINRMTAFIRQVVNDARQNAPSISVRAVDDAADPATAEVMSDLIRDIEAQSNADIAYDTAVDFAVSCGFGYFRVNTAYTDDDTFAQDIRIARIANPFSVYGDPFSDAPDSSDWNVAFVLDRMKRSVFEKRYAGADLKSWADPRWDTVGEPWKQEGDFVGVPEYWTREPVKKPIVALYNQNYARATQIADPVSALYRGERVADLTSGQRQAYGMVSDIAAGRTGADTLDQAKAGYSNLMNYAPAQIATPGAVQAGSVSASPIAAGMLRDTDLSAYMNPYTQNVIDTSLAGLSRARDVQRVADNQSATRANAFGGSRQGVADSLTNEAYLRNVSSTSANLRNAGYDKAVSAAIADLDRALGANQFNSGQAYDAQKTNVANRLTADQFNTGSVLTWRAPMPPTIWRARTSD